MDCNFTQFRITPMVYSLRTLFVATACVAVIAVALLYANVWWIAITTTGVYAVLVVSILAAVHCSPPLRTFWSGFAIAGWAYFILTSNVLSFVGQPQFLLTTAALDLVHAIIGRDGHPHLEHVRIVGHHFFTMLFGVLGGWATLRFRGGED
jgi:hypothetical protein